MAERRRSFVVHHGSKQDRCRRAQRRPLPRGQTDSPHRLTQQPANAHVQRRRDTHDGPEPRLDLRAQVRVSRLGQTRRPPQPSPRRRCAARSRLQGPCSSPARRGSDPGLHRVASRRYRSRRTRADPNRRGRFLASAPLRVVRVEPELRRRCGTGKRNPSLDNILKLADALNVNASCCSGASTESASSRASRQNRVSPSAGARW